MHLEFRVLGFLIELRIAELEDDVVGFHRGARAEQDPLDPSLRSGRNPANILRNQRSEPADLANHRSAFDGVGPERRRVHGRRGRPQPREPDADSCDDDEANREVASPLELLLAGIRWPGNIHVAILRRRKCEKGSDLFRRLGSGVRDQGLGTSAAQADCQCRLTMFRNATTTSGSNWVEAPRRSSETASTASSRRRYRRSWVIAS